MREEVAQPVGAAAHCPCLLAVSVQAIDGDDTAVLLTVNAQTSNKKHTQRSGWCLLLSLASRMQLRQIALLMLRMLRMLRVLQEPACVLVRMTEKSVWQTCLCLAVLRVEVRKPSHRVILGQRQRVRGVGRRMCSSIVREGCSEAELHSDCGMLALEAMEGPWLLLSLVVRCSARSARSAHAACQPH
jgi:hypothetical protein